MKTLAWFAAVASLVLVVHAAEKDADGVFIHSEDWIGEGEVMTRESDDNFCYVRPYYKPKKLLKYREGTLCGYWQTNYGHHERNLHGISVCCEVEENDGAREEPEPDDNGYECVSCGECVSPQIVAQECCGIALGLDGMGRDGSFGGCPGDELCCRCGGGNGTDAYACIPDDGVTKCDESACPPSDPVCEIPTPPVPDDYGDNIENITDCGDGGEGGRTIEMNNTLIILGKNIQCNETGPGLFFLKIVGDNNTVDCNGFLVGKTGGDSIDGFSFEGNNNVIQNCPSISGFDEYGIEAISGSLFVFNVSAAGNVFGLQSKGATVYIDGSSFATSADTGVIAVPSTTSEPLAVLVVKNSNINGNSVGLAIGGLFEACLENNDFSGNAVISIAIADGSFSGGPSGIPVVTLVNTDACGSASGLVDIVDNSDGNTDVVGTVFCDSVGADFDPEILNFTVINTTEYGCTPCP